jgi:hypothetical protein
MQSRALLVVEVVPRVDDDEVNVAPRCRFNDSSIRR